MSSRLDRDTIIRDAQRILDSFVAKLAQVELSSPLIATQTVSTREEGVISPLCSPEFKKQMLANAKQKTADAILVEKKEW